MSETKASMRVDPPPPHAPPSPSFHQVVMAFCQQRTHTYTNTHLNLFFPAQFHSQLLLQKDSEFQNLFS